jgi:transposase-like protein
MLSIKSLVERLGVFERNKVPLELKVLGLAFYIQLSSLRRAARALSKIHRVSKTAVWKWVRKLSEEICIDPPKMPKRLVALDETCVKVNGLEYWVYVAMDIDGNDVLCMGVFSSRNVLATKLFIEDVLKHCEGRPTFTVGSAPWLTGVLKELGLRYDVGSFR